MTTTRLAGLLSALLACGCTVPPIPPDAPPPMQAQPPTTEARAVPPAAPALPEDTQSPKPAPSVAKAEAPAPKPVAKPSRQPAPAAAPGKPESAPVPAAKPAEPAPLDLKALEKELKETQAIGLMTKISLKNQVDDLLEKFRAFHEGRLKASLAELRRPYELLLMKVLSLLQDGDPRLAQLIHASREALWGILSDRDKFAKVI